MKLIIFGFIVLLLLSACTHVSSSLETSEGVDSPVLPANQSNVVVVNETKIAEDKAKAAEELAKLAELEKSINSTIEQCSKSGDENKTWCFATKGADLMRQYGRIQDLHPVYTLCKYADDSNFCYFYAAISLNSPVYCNKVEDKTGCKLLSDPLFCSRLINPNQCLLDKAMLIRIADKSAAQKTCDMMKRFEKYPDAEKYKCDEVDFGEKYYDEESFKDRFFLMYVMTKLTGFEVNKTTVEDYARDVVWQNEHD